MKTKPVSKLQQIDNLRNQTWDAFAGILKSRGITASSYNATLPFGEKGFSRVVVGVGDIDKRKRDQTVRLCRRAFKATAQSVEVKLFNSESCGFSITAKVPVKTTPAGENEVRNIETLMAFQKLSDALEAVRNELNAGP